jgi:hypothetical protein
MGIAQMVNIALTMVIVMMTPAVCQIEIVRQALVVEMTETAILLEHVTLALNATQTNIALLRVNVVSCPCARPILTVRQIPIAR